MHLASALSISPGNNLRNSSIDMYMVPSGPFGFKEFVSSSIVSFWNPIAIDDLICSSELIIIILTFMLIFVLVILI